MKSNRSKRTVGILAAFIFIISLTVLTTFAGASKALAAEAGDTVYIYYENPTTGYKVFIDDAAGLLSEAELERLAGDPDGMLGITDYGNVGFATTDYNPYSADSYADSWLRSYLGTQSSVLFLIDMDNRRIQVQANNGSRNTIGGRITTSYANTITDNVFEYATDGDYYGCATEAFRQVYTVLEGGRIAQPMKYICNALLALALGMLTCYFIAKATSSAKRTTDSEMLMYTNNRVDYTPPTLTYTHTEKKYHPRSSGGGGGHGGGGGGGSHGGGHSF